MTFFMISLVMPPHSKPTLICASGLHGARRVADPGERDLEFIDRHLSLLDGPEKRRLEAAPRPLGALLRGDRFFEEDGILRLLADLGLPLFGHGLPFFFERGDELVRGERLLHEQDARVLALLRPGGDVDLHARVVDRRPAYLIAQDHDDVKVLAVVLHGVLGARGLVEERGRVFPFLGHAVDCQGAGCPQALDDRVLRRHRRREADDRGRGQDEREFPFLHDTPLGPARMRPISSTAEAASGA